MTIRQPEAEEPPEPEPETQEIKAKVYDIPMTEELQEYTFNLCEQYGVDYEMALALMDKESDYTASIISETKDHGIMQINEVNHEWLSKELGITDFLDPKQNILSGIYMLSELTAKYQDPHRILMAYNMGERGARNYVSRGNTSSAYSRDIMKTRSKLLQEAEDEQAASDKN